MPAAVYKPSPLVRNPSYFGLKTDKNHKRHKKSISWVDVSDEEDRGKKSLKRRNSAVNGHHDSAVNGHKHKKRRHSNDSSPQVNGAGPSQINGTLGTKAKALQEQRSQLPIAKGRDALIEEIRQNEVTILLGETGSGKTTQVPQYILESGLARNGMIAVTQPRKVAATSLAHRVAAEQNTTLGDLVGYAVRFDEKSSDQTRIKYLTDGMIVRELMSDPLLSNYSVIIVDEAHERTLRTDLLIANLKNIQKQRNQPSDAKGKGKANTSNPLKIVVMSATLDAEKFSKFYHNAKIIYVKGRQHPVKIYHAAESQLDYADAAMRTFFQIHTDQPPGDVLIFLPGQEDIESLQKSIELYAKQLPADKPAVLTCTMFAAQDHSQNNKAFNPTPPNMRKCILATNIAETSITIPGIKYVIDTGKCKEKQYLARISGGGFDTLLTRDITKSSAMQRTGRAGREGSGVCFRLYTEEAFQNMAVSGEPEILRCSLTASILNLKTLGQNLEELDLMDKPDFDTIASALKTLWLLGAIDQKQKLTPAGRKMAAFPLEPQYSCAVVASVQYNCVAPVLDIVSILSSSSKLFLDVTDQRTAAAEARRMFVHPRGDHLTVLNAFRAYKEIAAADSKSVRREWCRKHFLNERTFIEAKDIREQLVLVCRRVGINVEGEKEGGEEEEDGVIRSMGHGLAGNSAFLQPDGTYKQTMGQTIIKIHPGSSICDKKVPAIIYDDLMYTNQIYARGVSSIPKSFFLSVQAFNQRQA
ncbi:P-loop containing nucleoside triphosphate hydrolase protein [Pholiota conissans]|uniref:RNA helicase n=1 Tax=Pholiota conissans TaxID=109636 RepID=A0A9P5Z5R1_9AGAR|nr:P-loop containing nucleoside triphosphate hydrolase protein [Pholiota conissans]